MEIKIRLKSKINAGQRVLDQHGEWWKVIRTIEEKSIFEIESLDYTLRYRPMYACKAKRTIPCDGGELFTVIDSLHHTEPEPVLSESKYPILEKLLATNPT